MWLHVSFCLVIAVGNEHRSAGVLDLLIVSPDLPLQEPSHLVVSKVKLELPVLPACQCQIAYSKTGFPCWCFSWHSDLMICKQISKMSVIRLCVSNSLQESWRLMIMVMNFGVFMKETKLSGLTLSVLLGSEVAFNNPSDCFLCHLHQKEFKYTLMLRDLQLLRLMLNKLLPSLNFMTTSQSDLHT